jgi:hypothetical protein
MPIQPSWRLVAAAEYRTRAGDPGARIVLGSAAGESIRGRAISLIWSLNAPWHESFAFQRPRELWIAP